MRLVKGNMWSCFCLQPEKKFPQGFALDQDVVNSNQSDINCLHRLNSYRDDEFQAYKRLCTDDYICDRSSRPFTDVRGSNHDGPGACHLGWKISHPTSGTKRKRSDGRNRHTLADMSNNQYFSRGLQYSYRPQSYASRPYRNQAQSAPLVYWNNNSQFEEKTMVDHGAQRQLNGASRGESPYSSHSQHSVSAQYCPDHLPEQILSSSSARNTKSHQLSTLAFSQFGRNSASFPATYVKKDLDTDWLQQVVQGENGNGIDSTEDQKIFAAVLSPPPTAFLEDPRYGTGTTSQAPELPAWNFPDTRSYDLNDDATPPASYDLSFAVNSRSTCTWPTSPDNLEMTPSSGDACRFWADASFDTQSTMPPTKTGLFSCHPPLDFDEVLNADSQTIPHTQLSDHSSQFDPCLPAWNTENNNPIFDSSEPNFWTLPQGHDSQRSVSRTSKSEPPSLPSSSKRYRHEGTLGYRDEKKDQMLIQWKSEGLSYKEIKIKGQFEEAESTLRGRYRTLTKPKEARVRKPEWKQRDIQNLLIAVDHFTHRTEDDQPRARQRYSPYVRQQAQEDAAKIPWKQVAEYMGVLGSYRFGNATVKKKYLEIVGERGL